MNTTTDAAASVAAVATAATAVATAVTAVATAAVATATAADDDDDASATTATEVEKEAVAAAAEVAAGEVAVLPPADGRPNTLPLTSTAEAAAPTPAAAAANNKSDTAAAAVDAAPRRESQRAQRKSSSSTYDHSYVPQESFATKKEVVIPAGTGIKLSDMPTVVTNFKAVTWSDPTLKKLYTIVFGVGKKKEFKRHLMQFNGLVYPPNVIKDNGKDDTMERNRDLYKLKMYKLKMDELKEVMDLCDIDRSTESFSSGGEGGDDKKVKQQPDKEMLCIRFMEWLEDPQINTSDKKVTRKKKRKSTSTSSPAKTTPSKKKAKKSPASATKKSPASIKKTTKKSLTPTKKGRPPQERNDCCCC